MEWEVTCSRGSNNEGSIEVAIDNERGQGIVLANLMLLRVDLPCKQLVEVDDGLILVSGFMHIKLRLHLLLESHDHVKTIPIKHFKHEHVGARTLLTDCNRTS